MLLVDGCNASTIVWLIFKVIKYSMGGYFENYYSCKMS